MQPHQVAQRNRGAPARRRVVAHVKQSADGELAPGDVGDDAAVLVRDPAPDAVQRDDVELGQIIARRQLGERRIENLDVRARGRGQLARVCSLGRIEIGAPELAARSRRMNVERKSLAEPQLQIPRRPLDAMRLQLAQHRQLEVQRRHLAIVAVRVVELRHVSGGPRGSLLGHGEIKPQDNTLHAIARSGTYVADTTLICVVAEKPRRSSPFQPSRSIAHRAGCCLDLSGNPPSGVTPASWRSHASRHGEAVLRTDDGRGLGTHCCSGVMGQQETFAPRLRTSSFPWRRHCSAAYHRRSFPCSRRTAMIRPV